MSSRDRKIEVSDVVYRRLHEAAKQRGMTVSKYLDELMALADAKQRAN